MSVNDLPPVEAPGQAPSPPDLAGKASVEELAKAYRSSSAEATRLNQELQSMRQQSFRQEIPQRQASTPEDELNDYGVPVKALDAYVGRRIEQAFAPVFQAAGARNQVLTEYPDYTKFEAQIAAHIQSDPGLTARYQSMFQADPVGAIEWSIGKFAETQRKSAPPENEKRRGAAEAQVPSSRSAESRNSDNQYGEMLQEAKKRAMTTGRREDIERWTQLRLRQGISPEFYQTGHPGKR